MSDFFNWEDLDLDDLLGEYTDGDMCEFDSSDSSCEYDVESVSRTGAADVAEKKLKCTVLYCCPSCPKTYRSISGFRGHVMKVHNLLGLKGMIMVL